MPNPPLRKKTNAMTSEIEFTYPLDWSDVSKGGVTKSVNPAVEGRMDNEDAPVAIQAVI